MNLVKTQKTKIMTEMWVRETWKLRQEASEITVPEIVGIKPNDREDLRNLEMLGRSNLEDVRKAIVHNRASPRAGQCV